MKTLTEKSVSTAINLKGIELLIRAYRGETIKSSDFYGTQMPMKDVAESLAKLELFRKRETDVPFTGGAKTTEYMMSNTGRQFLEKLVDYARQNLPR